MSRSLLTCLALCLPFAAWGADAPAPDAAAFDLNGFMTSYYQHPQPDEIPQFMQAFAKSGGALVPAQADPVIAFLSQVFVANPDRLAGWQKQFADMNPYDRAVMEYAAVYSHNPKWILQLPYHTPSTNDMYWSAFFATGDMAYIQKIIDQLVYCDERTDPYIYLVGASAQWSLASNAQRDPKVHTIMEQSQKAATGRIAELLAQALKETPAQIHDDTIATLTAGKASGTWRPMPWQYQVSDIRKLEKDDSGKPKMVLDLKVADYFIAEIGKHIANYPPSFASETEKIEVLGRLQELLDVLDGWSVDTQGSELLRRTARANAMAYNVDVPGSYEMASGAYQELLKRDPNDADANYGYANVLGQTATGGKDALPYLLKARELGELRADYSLGYDYLILGDKDDAIKYLDRYVQEAPDQAGNARKLLDALKNGSTRIIH